MLDFHPTTILACICVSAACTHRTAMSGEACWVSCHSQKCVCALQARAKLSKILSYWGERGVYDLPTTAGIESSMTSTDNPPAALAISLAQAAAAAAAAAAAQAAASAAAQAQAAQLPPQVQQPPSGPWQATGALSPHGGYGAPPPAPWGAPGAGLGMPGAPPPQGAWPGAPPPPYGTPPPPGMPGMAPPGAPWGAAPPPHQHYAPPPPQGMPPQGMPMPPHGAPPPGHAAWGYQAPAPPGAPPPVQYAPPPDVSTSQRPTGFSSAPPPSSHHRQTGFSSAPPAGGVPPPFGMAPDMMQGGGNAQQQQEEVPPKEPVSSFNFPPGLLPGLCRQKKEAGADKYEPLDPDDIERIGGWALSADVFVGCLHGGSGQRHDSSLPACGTGTEGASACRMAATNRNAARVAKNVQWHATFQAIVYVCSAFTAAPQRIFIHSSSACAQSRPPPRHPCTRMHTHARRPAAAARA